MKRVIEIFREICAVPHGSGNMEKISQYCMAFAEKRGLEAHLDKAKNVIIKKKGTPGFEKSAPVILQGHMDMVCQKEEGVEIDFEKDGITPVIDGDFMKARGTTLGADNGIAVAMILAILEREDVSHPPIEAVFTTDEEVGLIGAGELDCSLLAGRRLINIDSEEEDTVTVSCAGGSDAILTYPIRKERIKGIPVEIVIGGLQGGHSGMEIGKGRVNADLLMGRVLSALSDEAELSLVEINGGNKGNAIPLACRFQGLTYDADAFLKKSEEILSVIREEISQREPNFFYEKKIFPEKEMLAVGKAESKRFFDALSLMPNGVMEMSPAIPDLVETSLNLGILKTQENEIALHCMLRSNVDSALFDLERRMQAFARLTGAACRVFGHYPPWEYSPVSPLRERYAEIYREDTGKEVRVEAIHAGLECGILSSGIPGLDCISIGPDLYHVHTVKEKMSLPSVERVYRRLLKLMKAMG